MGKPGILVVDDEPEWLSRCERFLKRAGLEVTTASDGALALKAFDPRDHDVVLTDLEMAGLDGMALMRRVKELSPETPVLMFTGYGTIQDAVAAMKEGALDFITKPFTPDQLKVSITRALRHRQLEAENRSLHEQLEDRFRFDNIIGRSAAMGRIFDMIRKIADTPASVLITGGTGTGKELIARSIHANSKRKSGPFVPLNCGGMPEQLVESELFGHEKGAFTGATGLRAGLIEHAGGGTFFMDEIGELPLNLQVKLLRVLEERKVRRVGSNREIDVDIRLISATNQGIEEMVQEGAFRQDLYYRINTFVMRVPSLKERTDDIPLLAGHFLKQCAEQAGKKIEGITEEAMEVLRRHSWPGNVRELQHIIERAVTLASSDEITPDDLPEDLGEGFDGGGAGGIEVQVQLPYMAAKDAAIEAFERTYIEHALSEHGGRVTRVAERIGVDRRSLYRILVRHGIDPVTFRR